MELCSGRADKSQTGTVGGEGTKKYDKFTHRLNVEWNTGRCTVVPQLPNRSKELKTNKSHTVTLKKFQKFFEKYSSCQQNKPKLGWHLTSKMLKIRPA